jgi:hypothetical protein
MWVVETVSKNIQISLASQETFVYNTPTPRRYAAERIRMSDLIPPCLALPRGTTVTVSPGDHFKLLLPDCTLLQVEQTADDFSIITNDEGIVKCSMPTSASAKKSDGDILE